MKFPKVRLLQENLYEQKKNKKKGGVMNMQNENISELKFLKNEMFFNMDCSYEGSTD